MAGIEPLLEVDELTTDAPSVQGAPQLQGKLQRPE